MPKYIEQEAAIEILNIAYPLGMDEAAYDTMHSMISKLPAADVVEVVRCKDCKWFGLAGCAIQIVDDTDKPSEDDFCSFGERKGGDE